MKSSTYRVILRAKALMPSAESFYDYSLRNDHYVRLYCISSKSLILYDSMLKRIDGSLCPVGNPKLIQ